MPVNVNQQTAIFLMCILTGMASGIICDILSITAKKLRFGKSAFFIQDIIIWLIILSFFFSVIYQIDGAMLRWYIFIGAFFGGLLYILLLRVITIKTTEFVIELIIKTVWRILRIMAFPIRKMLKILAPVTKYVKSARKKTCIFVQKNIAKFRRINILLKKI